LVQQDHDSGGIFWYSVCTSAVTNSSEEHFFFSTLTVRLQATGTLQILLRNDSECPRISGLSYAPSLGLGGALLVVCADHVGLRDLGLLALSEHGAVRSALTPIDSGDDGSRSGTGSCSSVTAAKSLVRYDNQTNRVLYPCNTDTNELSLLVFDAVTLQRVLTLSPQDLYFMDDGLAVGDGFAFVTGAVYEVLEVNLASGAMKSLMTHGPNAQPIWCQSSPVLDHVRGRFYCDAYFLLPEGQSAVGIASFDLAALQAGGSAAAANPGELLVTLWNAQSVSAALQCDGMRLAQAASPRAESVMLAKCITPLGSTTSANAGIWMVPIRLAPPPPPPPSPPAPPPKPGSPLSTGAMVGLVACAIVVAVVLSCMERRRCNRATCIAGLRWLLFPRPPSGRRLQEPEPNVAAAAVAEPGAVALADVHVSQRRGPPALGLSVNSSSLNEARRADMQEQLLPDGSSSEV
jgi:hypothetical protein